MASLMTPLPIDDSLPHLKTALAKSSAAILVAPPGAGKTTRVPLALIDEPWAAAKRIIMLEPRRIAARSAANFMATLLGEKVGETVGYRVRMDSKIGAKTRIEVVTEGIFTRVILEDPELGGVAAVLFDEFHERSLDGDLGLALALDVQAAFRPDLRILPMSATMDGAQVARLFDQVEIIECEGRGFPVDIQYRDKRANERMVEAMARTVRQLLTETTGSLLCFLPSQGEILQTAALLAEHAPENVEIAPLYGALSPLEQDKAIRPAGSGRRKIVLATSVAQTSLTIEGIRIVVDCGLSRVARYEPDTGLTRLETVRAAKASINQRAGRAGRTEPGIVVRLWHEGQTAALPEFEKPEILVADLSSLVLDLAQWGVSDPASLKWLDNPPVPSWSEAVSSLKSLGAIDENGLITRSGKAMRALGLPPRLAMMVMRSAEFGQAEKASLLAVILSERGLGGTSPDLASRLADAQLDKSRRTQTANHLASRIAKKIDNIHQDRNPALSIGALLSFAYPDRIAKRVGSNPNGEALYRLANGRQARLDGLAALGKCEYLVIAEMHGTAAASRIFSAAEIKLEEIHDYHGCNIQKQRKLSFSSETKQFHATQNTMLGSLELALQATSINSDDRLADGLTDALRQHGLGLIDFNNKAGALRARLGFLHYHMPDKFPDISEQHLLARLEEWLLPFMTNARSFSDIRANQLVDGLMLLAGYENAGEIEKLAPTVFVAPTGSEKNLKYEGEKAILEIRVQELYGLKNHPAVLDGILPIQMDLMSPAHRLIQTTTDLPRFWAGNWQDVRKEMKGRYPKHFWPQDPASAAPTKRPMRRKPAN